MWWFEESSGLNFWVSWMTVLHVCERATHSHIDIESPVWLKPHVALALCLAPKLIK